MTVDFNPQNRHRFAALPFEAHIEDVSYKRRQHIRIGLASCFHRNIVSQTHINSPLFLVSHDQATHVSHFHLVQSVAINFFPTFEFSFGFICSPDHPFAYMAENVVYWPVFDQGTNGLCKFGRVIARFVQLR